MIGNYRIVISGLTAAGKTTHGQRLANDLGLPFYSASDEFRRILAIENLRFGERWSPEIDVERKSTPNIDDQVDKSVSTAMDSGPGVFDAALLPWVTDRDDCLLVWLDSGVLSRTRKCYISHLGDLKMDLAQAAEIVSKKDRVSIQRVLSKRGGAMHPDSNLFHVIISNDDTLTENSRQAANDGIERFHPVFLSSIAFALGISDRPPRSDWVIHLQQLS